ncbi:MAG: hypothetical protein GY805_34590, partial [Chloroflexi bacterium]|nr:hypothetical protein [Chloroflexota bacterium]
ETPGTAPSFPPTVAITGLNGGDTVAGSILLSFAASDVEDTTASLTVEWNIDGGAWQLATFNGGSGDFEDTWDTTTAIDGSYTLNVQVTDSDTNTATDSISVNVDNTAPPGCTVNCLRVTDFTMNGWAWGPFFGRALARVTIEDENGTRVPSALVDVDWDFPDGSTLAENALTGGTGRTFFIEQNIYGTYTLTITDVTLAGYTFDVANSIISDSVTVP